MSEGKSGIKGSKLRHHSTGNLLLGNEEEEEEDPNADAAAGRATAKGSTKASASPRKGILKRPHTFHNDRERPATVGGRHLTSTATPFPFKPAGGEQQQQQQLPVGAKTATASSASSGTTSAAAAGIKSKQTMAPPAIAITQHMVEQQVEPVVRTAQHVEFSEELNAVFGDTTTDTEAGAGEPHSPSAATKNALALAMAAQQRVATAITRLPPTAAPPPTNRAIVSPLVRQPSSGASSLQQQQQQPRAPSPESSESGSSVRSNGTSHIVGKWWFGKSTKYVVHCDRRGCSHGHHGGGSRKGTPEELAQEQQQPYLTPTQRKQQEIAALKKELRRAQLACRDKEHHLAQLRDRLVEIESMVSTSTTAQMAKCAQLRQRLAEQEEEFIGERDTLMARHDHKVRQLVQEAVDLRAELARKEKALATRDRVQRKNQCVQTELSSEVESGNKLSPLVTPSPAATMGSSNAGISPTTTSISEQQPQIAPVEAKQEERRSTSAMPTTASAPTSPSRAPPLVQMGAELVATLEAYRTETVVWRTRCANLELIMQDLLIREGVRTGDTSPFANALIINVDNAAAVGDVDAGGMEQIFDAPSAPMPLAQRQKSDAATGSSSNLLQYKLDRTRSVDKLAAFEREQSLQPGAALRRSRECLMASCVERRRKLLEENETLTEQTNQLEHELSELRDRCADSDKETKLLMAEHIQLAKEHAELAALAETRVCQEKVVKLALNEVKDEREKLEQALSYMERRCRAYELIGLDRGMVLVDEEQLAMSAALRNEFRVDSSLGCQTELTVDELGLTEQQLSDLQIRIRVLQNAFAEDKAQMGAQLTEIEHVLELKTQLINTLTDQLDEAAQQARAEAERHQRERDVFMDRIEELGRVAERVPILESECERALQDKSHRELQIRKLEEQLEDAMDHALDTTMERNRLNEDYWSERMDALDRERRALQLQLEHERRKGADAQMALQVQKAELSAQLTSAIEHAAYLNAKLNCPRRDAQVDVRPRTHNKYISCKPNQRDVEVGAELRDEQMERLQQQLAAFSDEKQMLLDGMAQLEAEALEATEWMLQQQQRDATIGGGGGGKARGAKQMLLDGTEAGKMSLLRLTEEKKATTRRRATTGSPDFLTVSFHRKGELIQFGGRASASSSRAASATLLEEEGISIVSLPTVLDEESRALMPAAQTLRAQHLIEPNVGGGRKQRSYSLRSAVLTQRTDYDDKEEERDNLLGTKDSVRFRREHSVPVPNNTLTVPRAAAQQQQQRCHSAPKRQEMDQTTTAIVQQTAASFKSSAEGMAAQMDVPMIQITPSFVDTAEELRDRVRVFRRRIVEMLSVGLAPGPEPECTPREVQCTLGQELFDQMDGWLEAVAQQQKHSWHMQTELELLKRECGRLRERLKDAEMELWIYRTEPRRAALERRQLGGMRSCSAEHLGSGPPLAARHLRRWKVIAGTCFREVNQLRGRLSRADKERLQLRNQVAILRGELVWAKCKSRHSGIIGGHWDDDGDKMNGEAAARRKRSIADIEPFGDTLESYNRWLGGNRWQSVPELDDADATTMAQQQRKGGKMRKPMDKRGKEGGADGRDEILMEAYRKQFVSLKEERDRLALAEQEALAKIKAKEAAEKQLGLQVRQVEAECALLRRENGMYEQKCVEMDKERQQMYLIMFRKGQQAASQEVHDELDKQAELQVVLRFLHDAFFYYLLNKGNAREHLQAIMTMLNFTVEQKEEVYRRKGKSH